MHPNQNNLNDSSQILEHPPPINSENNLTIITTENSQQNALINDANTGVITNTSIVPSHGSLMLEPDISRVLPPENPSLHNQDSVILQNNTSISTSHGIAFQACGEMLPVVTEPNQILPVTSETNLTPPIVEGQTSLFLNKVNEVKNTHSMPNSNSFEGDKNMYTFTVNTGENMQTSSMLDNCNKSSMYTPPIQNSDVYSFPTTYSADHQYLAIIPSDRPQITVLHAGSNQCYTAYNYDNGNLYLNNEVPVLNHLIPVQTTTQNSSPNL